MFNLFPFNLGNGFSFSSFTSITGSNGVNFFGGINGYFGSNGIENIGSYNNGMNNMFNNQFYNNQISNSRENYNSLNDVDINEIANEVRNLLIDIGKQINIEEIAGEYINAINNMALQNGKLEEDECTFIKFKELSDMYVLKIDLTGIDLRELSVKYDPGIIQIRLKRTEMEDDRYSNNRIIKREYNKTFNNIEEVDITRVIKNVDGRSFNLTMPKKYLVEQGSNVIDVDKFIVEKDNPRLKG